MGTLHNAAALPPIHVLMGTKTHHSGMTKPVAERRAKYSKARATASTSWLARVASKSSPNSTVVVIRSVCAPGETASSVRVLSALQNEGGAASTLLYGYMGGVTMVCPQLS